MRRSHKSLIIVLLYFLQIATSMVYAAPPTRGSYTINGKINDVQHSIVYLSYQYNYRIYTDSAIIENGTFQLKGVIPEPLICTLKVAGNNQQVSFFVEKGSFSFEADSRKLYDGVLKGSKQNDVWNDYKRNYFGKLPKRGAPGDTAFLSAYGRAVSLFVERNTQWVAAAVIIYDKYIAHLDVKKATALYGQLNQEVQQSYYGKRILYRLESSKRISEGKIAPDFTLSDSSGNLYSLKQFRGKYVLVDFWASWCGPCRKENPTLKEAYRKYAGQGLEIVSISIDQDKRSWLNAVHTDQLQWLQLSDLNRFAVSLYGISSIPKNFLLDPGGVIIAKDLRGEQLEVKLNEIF